jgi:hypothetical protein
MHPVQSPGRSTRCLVAGNDHDRQPIDILMSPRTRRNARAPSPRLASIRRCQQYLAFFDDDANARLTVPPPIRHSSRPIRTRVQARYPQPSSRSQRLRGMPLRYLASAEAVAAPDVSITTQMGNVHGPARRARADFAVGAP